MLWEIWREEGRRSWQELSRFTCGCVNGCEACLLEWETSATVHCGGKLACVEMEIMGSDLCLSVALGVAIFSTGFKIL